MKGFRAPGEPAAQERTWRVVAAAFEEREPVHARRRLPARYAIALAVAAAATAVAFTPPGHAVLSSVREAIGVAGADRALYSLPAPGRILAGGWVVDADGSARRLGDYRETSWSPFGRFVVAARDDELVTLEPNGTVHWTLARPNVRFPRWTGSHADTRIAYLSGDRLHVVAGDGARDREVGPAAAAAVAPAWRPGLPFTVTYADTRGRVWAFEPDTGRLRFATAGGSRPLRLAWSSDGMRLLVVRRGRLDVFDARGRRVAHAGGPFVDAAFLPHGRRVVTLTRHAVALAAPHRTLFRTSGSLAQVLPAPNGRWVLVTWPDADQWLFVPVRPGRVRAIGNIAEQLGGGFPVGGWTS